jgi:hypothetical protein
VRVDLPYRRWRKNFQDFKKRENDAVYEVVAGRIKSRRSERTLE